MFGWCVSSYPDVTTHPCVHHGLIYQMQIDRASIRFLCKALALFRPRENPTSCWNLSPDTGPWCCHWLCLYLLSVFLLEQVHFCVEYPLVSASWWSDSHPILLILLGTWSYTITFRFFGNIRRRSVACFSSQSHLNSTVFHPGVLKLAVHAHAVISRSTEYLISLPDCRWNILWLGIIQCRRVMSHGTQTVHASLPSQS